MTDIEHCPSCGYVQGVRPEHRKGCNVTAETTEERLREAYDDAYEAYEYALQHRTPGEIDAALDACDAAYAALRAEIQRPLREALLDIATHVWQPSEAFRILHPEGSDTNEVP
jgi:hypothetical protein